MGFTNGVCPVFKSIINFIYEMIKICTILGGVGVVSVWGWEYTKPADEYFNHYGNVTVRDAYIFPEHITVYSFGSHLTDVHTTDTLWCVSADSVSRQWVLIGTTYTASVHSVLNTLPPGTDALPISNNNVHSDLGVSYRHILVDLRDSGYPIVHWSMGRTHPDVGSSCYIETSVSAYSEVFSIPKTITFTSVEFSYLYE